jgi:hypothetical protein
VTEPLVPHHLLEHLTEREQHARAEIDRLRAAIAALTVQMKPPSSWPTASMDPNEK